MKLELVRFKNGNYGIRSVEKKRPHHSMKETETFLRNAGGFQFGTRRTPNFTSAFMFATAVHAQLRLEDYKAYKLALEEDKKECNSPVVEIVLTVELEDYQINE